MQSSLNRARLLATGPLKGGLRAAAGGTRRDTVTPVAEEEFRSFAEILGDLMGTLSERMAHASEREEGR